MDNRRTWPRPSASRLPIALAGALAAGMAMLAAITITRAEAFKLQAVDVSTRMALPAMLGPEGPAGGNWRWDVQ